MSSVVISGDTSGTVSLTVPAVAGTNTATLPAATGTVMVSGNMPAFSYYQSVAQTLASATFTKITFTTSEFDTTGGMYAASRVTPTVAGYYQISGGLATSSTATGIFFYMYKNGALYKNMGGVGGTVGAASGSALVYCNGTTDYIELYGYFVVGQNTSNNLYATYFQGSLVRAA